MLRIGAIEPTVLFVRKKDKLLQLIDVVVDNRGEPAEADLEFDFRSGRTEFHLGRIERGRQTCRISAPDLRDALSVEFVLKSGGQVRDRLAMDWKPGKHWEVYMTPIAHHDLGYTDTIEEVLRKYCRIYEDVLRFCEETEDWPEESRFRYMIEQSWSIQHFIEQSGRETHAKLERYIRAGRIEIPAFFGNEISGLCSHEELVRLMYPSFRIGRQFGARITSAAITDIPGLSWGIPTVLAGAGVKYFFAGLPFYFHWTIENDRLNQSGRNDIHTFWDESSILRPHGRPDAFYWKGPDGKKILVFYQGGYGGWSPKSCNEIMEQLPSMLGQMETSGCPFSVMRYGGYGCGDNLGPDLVVSRIVREWNSQWAYPRLVVATHTMFFEELEKQCENIRTFSGELPDTDYPVGAVSTAMETALNRVTHDRLHAAEKLASIVSMLGAGENSGPAKHDYTGENIRDAYKNMLLFDEHTWGKSYNFGTVQDWAWNEKSRYAYKAAGLAEITVAQSAGQIAGAISIARKEKHIVVFNPLSFARTDVVFLRPVPRYLTQGAFDLLDMETGQKTFLQMVELESPQSPVPHAAGRYARGQFDRRELMSSELISLVFTAENVPAMGYKTYRIVPREDGQTKANEISINGTSIENRFFRVELNPETGTVTGIYDKELNRELVDKNAPHQVNQLVTRWAETGKTESPVRAEIRRGQAVPVYGSLIVTAAGAGCPQLTQEIILYRDLKRIDFNNRILKDSTPAQEIYFAFPFAVERPDFRFEGCNSVIKPLRDQFPGSNTNYYSVQHWADVCGEWGGITFSSLDAHLMEFGGLQPCYVSQAHHGVTPPDFGAPFTSEMHRGHMYSFVLDSNFRTNFQATQQGDMLFRYSITTHRGDWRHGRAAAFGWSAANPLVPVIVNGKQKGKLPESLGFCRVDKPNVMLTAFKRAEDGKGFIARLTEMEGVKTSLKLTCPFGKLTKAYLTNLVEENESEIHVDDHGLTVSLAPFSIATVRIFYGET